MALLKDTNPQILELKKKKAFKTFKEFFLFTFYIDMVQLLQDKPELFTNPSRLILTIAETIENSVGGTSGAVSHIFLK